LIIFVLSVSGFQQHVSAFYTDISQKKLHNLATLVCYRHAKFDPIISAESRYMGTGAKVVTFAFILLATFSCEHAMPCQSKFCCSSTYVQRWQVKKHSPALHPPAGVLVAVVHLTLDTAHIYTVSVICYNVLTFFIRSQAFVVRFCLSRGHMKADYQGNIDLQFQKNPFIIA
jgi:hypothetical protein